MLFEDEEEQMDCAENDYGMDSLARSLGLDIEAIARELAMTGDLKPTQCHPIITDTS
jgi:hypothetical protein